MAKTDIDTQKSIRLQEQQMANNTAMTEANVKAMDQQAKNEFRKSMAELGAKNVKSAGEKLAGLA
jgi:hypothetical protein